MKGEEGTPADGLTSTTERKGPEPARAVRILTHDDFRQGDVGYGAEGSAASPKPEPDMHAPICQAVTLLNIGNSREAHDLLRQALIDYADWAEESAAALAEEASAKEVREAFGDLSDAALAGLAGAEPEQIERIEQFILTECYPMHASPAERLGLAIEAEVDSWKQVPDHFHGAMKRRMWKAVCAALAQPVSPAPEADK